MATTNEINGAIQRLNNNLKPSGRFVELGQRNGYKALDLYSIKDNRCLECFATTNTNTEMLNLVYSLSRAIELVNNPI